MHCSNDHVTEFDQFALQPNGDNKLSLTCLEYPVSSLVVWTDLGDINLVLETSPDKNLSMGLEAALPQPELQENLVIEQG